MVSKSMELKCNVFWFCIAGIKAPICAVSGAQYLAASGWTELRNAIDLDVPFRLFRDEGRTFLQVKNKAKFFHYREHAIDFYYRMANSSFNYIQIFTNANIY